MTLRLLKFGATWCKPCHAQDEELKRVTCPYTPVDVEQDTDMANEYGIRSVPTLILLDDENNILRRWSGFTKAEVINQEVEKYERD